MFHRLPRYGMGLLGERNDFEACVVSGLLGSVKVAVEFDGSRHDFSQQFEKVVELAKWFRKQHARVVAGEDFATVMDGPAGLPVYITGTRIFADKPEPKTP